MSVELIKELTTELGDSSETIAKLILEIERLGRCNEQISHTFSTIITQQNAEIERLQAIVDATQHDDGVIRITEAARASDDEYDLLFKPILIESGEK